MLHALLLVEVEYGGAEDFFETFFEVAFVDGYFAAELLDSDRVTDVLKQYFSGSIDTLPAKLIGKKAA